MLGGLLTPPRCTRPWSSSTRPEIKRFHEPQPLQERLAALGWSALVQATPEFFIYGQATPAP
jgi:hypothetical protein